MYKSDKDQRFSYIGDVVCDYISDESLTSKDFIDDIKTEVQSLFEYFSKHAQKCQEVMDLLNGVPARGSNYELYKNAHINSVYNNDWLEKAYKEMKKNYDENISAASKNDWVDFWEECYYPEEAYRDSSRGVHNSPHFP